MKWGVLISGSGTNLQALIDATQEPGFPAEIALVISNRADAFGLQRAANAGIPTCVLPNKGFTSRELYDAELVKLLTNAVVEWVALAGFMRIITGTLLEAFPNRILNIHPSLLPAFPGLHAQAQAFSAGVRITGASVHFVDGGMDTGPLIAQGAVPVLPTDDESSLQKRILRMEHRLYPQVMRWASEGKVAVRDGRAHLDLSGDQLPFWFDPTP